MAQSPPNTLGYEQWGYNKHDINYTAYHSGLQSTYSMAGMVLDTINRDRKDKDHLLKKNTDSKTERQLTNEITIKQMTKMLKTLHIWCGQDCKERHLLVGE